MKNKIWGTIAVAILLLIAMGLGVLAVFRLCISTVLPSPS